MTHHRLEKCHYSRVNEGMRKVGPVTGTVIFFHLSKHKGPLFEILKSPHEQFFWGQFFYKQPVVTSLCVRGTLTNRIFGYLHSIKQLHPMVRAENEVENNGMD